MDLGSNRSCPTATSDDGWLFDATSSVFPLEDPSLSDALALVDATGFVSLEDLLLLETTGDDDASHSHGDTTTPPSPLDSGSSTTSTTSTSIIEPQQKKLKQPSTMRQREELLYLRSTVAQLENELASLKKQGTTNNTASDPLAYAWEAIATRQLRQRQHAEMENTTLRRLVEEQLRVAKSFERLLKKRSVMELVASSNRRRPRIERALQAHSPSTSEFQELLETVQNMYSDLPHVFGDAHFACTSLPMCDIQVRADESLGTIVEAFDVRIAPFELLELAHATWQFMAVHSQPQQQTFHLDHVEMADDQFTREFITTLDTPRLKATFHGKIVARRYVEHTTHNRVVILWASFMKPYTQDGGNKSQELAMKQQGYVILSPAPSHLGLGRGAAASLTQTYLVFQPSERYSGQNTRNKDDDSTGDGAHGNSNGNGSSTRPTRRKVGALTHFVVTCATLHMEEGRQIIENLMLEK